MSGIKTISLVVVVAATLALASGQRAQAQMPPQDDRAWQRGGRGFGMQHGQRHGRHMGDWLRKHQNLPPEQQERALENDPEFQRLPPERQEHLRELLRRFNSRSPEERQRMLDRMETFEHLPPQEQQRIHQLFGQMRQLPEERRRMVHRAARRLRTMDPAEREQELNSPQFRGNFSDQERELLRGLAELDRGRGRPGDVPPAGAPPGEPPPGPR